MSGWYNRCKPGWADSLSTGHIEYRARSVRSFLRQQPQNGGRYLFRLSAAFHRDHRLDTIHARRLATLRMQFGMNESRPDAVDPNILFRDFLRQTDGESVHGTFGCGIVDVLAR